MMSKQSLFMLGYEAYQLCAVRRWDDLTPS